jgi:hypothetical protein
MRQSPTHSQPSVLSEALLISYAGVDKWKGQPNCTRPGGGGFSEQVLSRCGPLPGGRGRRYSLATSGQAEAGDAGPGRRRESIARVSYVRLSWPMRTAGRLRAKTAVAPPPEVAMRFVLTVALFISA